MRKNSLVLALCFLAFLTAQAATFTPPINTSIGQSSDSDIVTGSLGGTISPDGSSLQLFSVGPVTYSVPSVSPEPPLSTITLTWSGTGTGLLTGTLPVSWLFDVSVSDSDSLASLSWILSVFINGNELYSSPETFAESSSQRVTGGGIITLPNETLNTWQVNLVVNYVALFDGDSLTIDVPSQTTIDLGPLAATAVPEPSSPGMMIVGAAGLAALVRRRTL